MVMRMAMATARVRMRHCSAIVGLYPSKREWTAYERSLAWPDRDTKYQVLDSLDQLRVLEMVTRMVKVKRWYLRMAIGVEHTRSKCWMSMVMVTVRAMMLDSSVSLVCYRLRLLLLSFWLRVSRSMPDRLRCEDGERTSCDYERVYRNRSIKIRH